MRLTFETDARNDYFTRAAYRGAFDLIWKGSDGAEFKASSIGPNLKNGIATVMADLPSGASVGDEIEFIARTDGAIYSFENRIKVTIQPKAKKHTGGDGDRKPPKDKDGAERERPSKLDSLKVRHVYRKDWDAEGFDEHTAMKIEFLSYWKMKPLRSMNSRSTWDNMPLESEAKQRQFSKEDIALLRQGFVYANVLIGLSMILGDKDTKKAENGDGDAPAETIEDRVEHTCRALAPFIPALLYLLPELGSPGSRDSETDDAEGLEESA